MYLFSHYSFMLGKATKGRKWLQMLIAFISKGYKD